MERTSSIRDQQPIECEGPPNAAAAEEFIIEAMWRFLGGRGRIWTCDRGSLIAPSTRCGERFLTATKRSLTCSRRSQPAFIST